MRSSPQRAPEGPALPRPPLLLYLLLLASAVATLTGIPIFERAVREGRRPPAILLGAPLLLAAFIALFALYRFALVREMVLAFPAADYRKGAIPAGYTPTVADRLGDIAAPALVIVGEDDIPDFRLIADILAANLPNARRLVIPDCGHVPPLEHSDAFNAALVNFLQEASAPT